MCVFTDILVQFINSFMKTDWLLVRGLVLDVSSVGQLGGGRITSYA